MMWLLRWTAKRSTDSPEPGKPTLPALMFMYNINSAFRYLNMKSALNLRLPRARERGIEMQYEEQILVVTPDVIENVLEDYINRQEDYRLEPPQEYLELFLSKSRQGTWTAIDNIDGYAWTEDFKNECVARRWLQGELNTDEAYEIDEKRKYIATCKKAGEFDNFAPGIEAVTHYDIFLEGGKLYTEDHPTGTIRRYGYNPPATQSEEKTIADVIMHCGIDKRWTVRAYQ